MENKTTSKKTIILLLLLVLTGGLFLLLKTVSERKALQQKASGTGPVSVSLRPASKSVRVGETVNVEVVLSSTADVSIGTFDLDIDYDAGVLDVAENQITCASTFPRPQARAVLTDKIRFGCFIEPGNPRYILQSGSTVVAASFLVVVKALPAVGNTTSLDFSRLVIVDGSYESLVGGSTGAVFQIQAQAGPVTIYLDPGNGSTIRKGETTLVAVKAVSSRSQAVKAVDTIISFDQSVFNVTDVVCDNSVFASTITARTAAGKIDLVCFRTPGSSEYALGSTPVTIGTFKLSVKDAAAVGSQTTLSFVQAEMPKPGMPDTSEENLIGVSAPTNYTIGIVGQPTPTATVTPAMHPIDWKTDNAWLKADDLAITLPGGLKYHGATTALTIRSDPGNPEYTTLEATWAENNREMRLYMYFKRVGDTWRSEEIRTYDGNSPGEWIYYRGLYFNKSIETPFSSPKFTIESEQGNAKIEFANIWLKVDFIKFVIIPTPTTTPPAGTPVLAFSIRSQGILDTKRADQKVTVKVKKGTFEKIFTNINLVGDTVGVYSGQVTLDGVTPGTGYAIFVKGPKHLAKKFCTDNPTSDYRCKDPIDDLTKVNTTEISIYNNRIDTAVTAIDQFSQVKFINKTSQSIRVQGVGLSAGPLNPGENLTQRYVSPGDYQYQVPELNLGGTVSVKGNLTLIAGTNTFNWSRVFMEGGDLPLVNGQNGVVNSADYNFINGHFDSTNIADLAIADINLDGVVNVGDRMLLRNTLETKYEEDY